MSANISHQDASLALQCFLIPQITYSLSVARLSINETKNLEREYISFALAKIGINRNFPRQICLSSNKFCGLGIPSISTIIIQKKVSTLLGHLRSKSPCCQIIRNTASFHQLEVGSQTNFLTLPFTTHGKFTTNTWLTNVWSMRPAST